MGLLAHFISMSPSLFKQKAYICLRCLTCFAWDPNISDKNSKHNAPEHKKTGT